MKRNGILNSEIVSVLARMGHTDMIAIADCGLPIPDRVKRIDLAYDIGKPSFIELLQLILIDMEVEKVTMAVEIKQHNTHLWKKIEPLVQDKEREFVSHEQFKLACQQTKAVIRTGENTPYANMILHAGVIF